MADFLRVYGGMEWPVRVLRGLERISALQQPTTVTTCSLCQELAKHISVDIVGGCGKLKDSDVPDDSHYKFYLAFENSNCQVMSRLSQIDLIML